MAMPFHFFAKSSIFCIISTILCQQTIAQESISLIKKNPTDAFDKLVTKSLIIKPDIAVKLAASPSAMMTTRLPNGRANAIAIGGSMPFGSGAVALINDGISGAPLAYLDPSLINIANGLLESIAVSHTPQASTSLTRLTGSVSLVSDQINIDQSGGLLDARYGSDQNKYISLKYSGQEDLWGGLVSYNRQEGDSYRQNRFGQSGGFKTNDLLVRIKELDLDSVSSKQNTEFKIHYQDYENNESRFGVSTKDLAERPMRRYMATTGDFERQKNIAFHIKHKSILLSNELVTTDLYYNDGNAQLLQTTGTQGESGHQAVAIIAQLESDPNASVKIEKRRLERSYSSWGVGVKIEQQVNGHQLVLGALHHSESLRDRVNAELFTMELDYLLSDTDGGEEPALYKDTARVNSIFLTDYWQQQQWTIDFGVRYQKIMMGRESSNIKNDPLINNDYSLILWNGNLKYQYNRDWSFVVSSAQGFLPLRSSQTQVNPMKSVITRAGALYHNDSLDFSAISFYNSFSSMMGQCNNGAGCDNAENVGRGKNVGIELSLSTQWQFGKYFMPLEIAYSYNKAKFSNDFSNHYDGFSVSSGDRFPYTPVNQLWLQFGALFDQWTVTSQLVYRGSQQGWSGNAPFGDINHAIILDLNTSYQLDRLQKFYFNIQNLTNEVYVESFYHAGLMAGSDRRFTLGYQLVL